MHFAWGPFVPSQPFVAQIQCWPRARRKIERAEASALDEGKPRIHVSPARSILSNALNFRRSASAALVRSPSRYCPFRLPEGAPLPIAPPCNRQRPFFVAGDRQGFPLLVRAPHGRAC
jgi:hypothetical protein